MKRQLSILSFSITFLILLLAISSTIYAKDNYPKGYAEDRAQIEDLINRYLWAMDFDDLELFASLFTEDATFIVKGEKGTLHGRKAILKSVTERYEKSQAKAKSELDRKHPARPHYWVTNLVLKVDGNTATGRSYWYGAVNNNPERKAVLGSYGHYDDKYVKVDGEWLFSYRKVYYENRDGLFSKGGNPAW